MNGFTKYPISVSIKPAAAQGTASNSEGTVMTWRKLRILATILASITWGSPGSVLASPITYHMDLVLGTATVVGDITTDGTIGTIDGSNILGFNLTLTNGPYADVLNNNGLFTSGNSLTATISALFFDFSTNTGGGLVFGSSTGLGFEDLTGAVSFHPSTISFNLLAIGDPDSPIWVDRVGNVLIATATPIPAALPLFATGLGALGLVAWRRRRRAWLQDIAFKNGSRRRMAC